jgi:hypothetical protein
MKVQILRLDAQDDLASIQDRLAWIQAGRVILVWPAEGIRLHRRLDLLLLQRRAERRGAQLGLVTRDPAIQDYARLLGIPLLASEDSLEQEAWRRGRRSRTSILRPAPLELRPEPPPRLGHALPSTRTGRLGRWAVFLVAMLAPLTLAVALIPSAEVSLTPETQAHTAPLTFVLDPQADDSSQEGVLPARQITVTLRGERRTPTTATTLQPGPQAVGSVVFTNLTDEVVRIPAGSGLRAGGSDGPRFSVTAEVSVYPGRGQQVVAPIEALAGGPQGNVPGGAINTVDGPLGLLVAVANPQAITGGELVARPSVSSADQQAIEAALRAALADEALQSLRSRLTDDEQLAEETIRVVEVSEMVFDHAVDEPTDSVGLTLAIEFAALTYSQSQAEAAVRNTLLGSLHPGRAFVDESLRLQVVPLAEQGGPTRLAVEARYETYARIDRGQAARLIRGQPSAIAAPRLQAALGLLNPPRIVLSPAWLPRLPLLPHRIHFSFDWMTS